MATSPRHSRNLGDRSRAQHRLEEVAYKLFCRKGINAVGTEELIVSSGVARMTLYRHYKSKDNLILSFLELREKRWTIGWLKDEATRRATNSRARLLAIFDLFDEWFQTKDFRGCEFINVMIESKYGGRTHRAAAQKLTNIRSVLKNWAMEASLADTERFAVAWHILMKGAIITAQEGVKGAAIEAKRTAALVLENWPKQKCVRKKINQQKAA